MNSIFQFHEYALPIENFQPKFIIDGGGNIGCSAVYFANLYKDAQIYSVEPATDNFKLLKYNTSFYDNIHVINSALWHKETFIKVKMIENNLGWMASETNANDLNAIKTTTILKILKESGFDKIDLLKIDIEGAEKEVFSDPNVDEWLSKVNVLVIELHDRMKRGCGNAFFRAMTKYNWFFAFRGENLIFIREGINQKVKNAYSW